jgi:hypothetical protein
MALFIDGTAATIEELCKYEGSILEVAHTEQIDLTEKLELARRELLNELRIFLGRETGGAAEAYIINGIEVSAVAVTPALLEWHAVRALHLAYADAVGQQSNSRHEGKKREYAVRDREAKERLQEIGVGVVRRPIPRAAAPYVSQVPGGGSAYDCLVSVAWVNWANEEGEPSAPVSWAVGQDRVLMVAVPHAPAEVRGWNVYIGRTYNDMSRQNLEPVDPSSVYYQTTSLSVGTACRSGQAADFYVPRSRMLRRG